MEEPQEQELAERYREGLSLYEQKDFRGALEIFDEILIVQPNYKRASRYAAACRDSLSGSSPKENEDEITQQELLQAYADALQCFQEKRFEEAIDHFEAIQLANPAYRTEKIQDLLNRARQKLHEEGPSPQEKTSPVETQDEEGLSDHTQPFPVIAPIQQGEEPRVETSQVEEAQEDTQVPPSMEQPEMDEPAPEEPQVEERSLEETRLIEPRIEKPQVEAAHLEGPQTDGPRLERSQAEEPHVEEPEVEAPPAEASQEETPVPPPIEDALEKTQPMKVRRSKTHGSKLPLLVGVGGAAFLALVGIVWVLVSGGKETPKPDEINVAAKPTSTPPPPPTATPLPRSDPREVVIASILSNAKEKIEEDDLDEAQKVLQHSLTNSERQREDVLALLRDLEQRRASQESQRQAQEREEQKEYMMRDANKAVQAKNWKQAEFLAKRILELHGEDEEAREILQTAEKELLLEKKKEQYRKEIALASAALQKKNSKSAAFHTKNAKDLLGNTADVRKLEAEIQKLEGKERPTGDAAADSAEKPQVSETGPDGSDKGLSIFQRRKVKRLEKKATDQHQAGQDEEALRTLEELFAMDPDNGVGKTLKTLIEKKK